jgi:hypothetical protein
MLWQPMSHKHATALADRVPEPALVRPAVFLGGARQRQRPHLPLHRLELGQLRLDRLHEDLVLEVGRINMIGHLCRTVIDLASTQIILADSGRKLFCTAGTPPNNPININISNLLQGPQMKVRYKSSPHHDRVVILPLVSS